MATKDRWRFELSDGTVPLRLEWHRGTSLPRPSSGIVAIKTNPGKVEWATASVKCPDCRAFFAILPVGPGGYYGEKMRLPKVVLDTGRIAEVECANIAGELISAEAMEILALIGNVAIDTNRDLYARCPKCGHVHIVKPFSEAMRMEVSLSRKGILVRCPGGETVVFEQGGRARLDYLHAGRGAIAELHDLMSLPRMIGLSQEALSFLTWILGIGVGRQRIPGAINITGIALRYRFRNYDDSFYSTAKAILAHKELSANARSSLFLLPVDGGDMEALHKLLDAGGLPDKPSVRRAGARCPALLAFIAGTGIGKICGADPNVTVSLFDAAEKDVAFLASLLNADGKLSCFFRILAEEEKPSVLLKRLKTAGTSVVSHAVSEYSTFAIGQYEAMKAYRRARKSYGMAALVDNPKLMLPYVENKCDADITYKVRSLDLEGEFGSYVFELPRNTRQLREAGATLKNCLGSYTLLVQSGKTLIFLVSKGNSLVAAVEVNPDDHSIVQIKGKTNREISPDEPIGQATKMWIADRQLKSGEHKW